MNWWNQPEFRDKDGILCDGAVRSGKTMALCCGFFLWSMARFDGAVFALCGKTVGSLRRNVILQLGSWLGDLFTVTEHRQDNRLTVRLGSRVNTYYLFGGQDESSYMTIQGITLAGVLLDEVVLMPRSFVEQAVARCSVEGAKLWFSCNPEGPEHWFFREWVEKAAQKNLLRLHFTMDDNPGLSPAVRSRYDRLYTGIFYRRYVLGQWCKAEGLVYDFRKDKHLFQAPTPEGRWYISVDYGTYNAFSAGLWCVVGAGDHTGPSHSSVIPRERSDRGNLHRTAQQPSMGIATACNASLAMTGGGRDVAIRVREFYHSGRDTGRLLTDEEYHRALEELAGDAPVEFVVIDPSAASMKECLRKHGRFKTQDADNSVLDGIRFTGVMIKSGKAKVHESCRNTIKEFGLYRWDEKTSQDAVVKENDHSMDQMRYLFQTLRNKYFKEKNRNYTSLWMTG